MIPDEPVRPTPERMRHAGEDFEIPTPDETIHFGAIRMLDGSPLCRLEARERRKPGRGITGDQYEAGSRYFADWYFAGLAASGVIDLARERVDGATYKDIPEYRIAAQTRFNRVCKMLSPVDRHVLDDVILSEVPLEVYADRYRHLSARRDRWIAALTTLRNALTALAIAYNRPRRSAGIVAAHTSDYRPTELPDDPAS